MKKGMFVLSVVSQEKLIKEPYGKNILSLLYNYDSKTSPEYANSYEPIHKSISNTEMALHY